MFYFFQLRKMKSTVESVIQTISKKKECGEKQMRDCKLLFVPNSNFPVFRLILSNPGVFSWKFLVGVCRPVLQILTLLRTKKCHFSHTFSDLASKKLYTPVVYNYPLSDQNGAKTIPSGVANTCMAYIRAYPRVFFYSVQHAH